MGKLTQKAQNATNDDPVTQDERSDAQHPVDTSTNETALQGVGCITSVATKEYGNKKTNLPNSVLYTSIGVVRNKKIWDKTFNLDLGALFVGFDMGEEFEDGGPESSPGQEISGGDLNIYKPVEDEDEVERLAILQVGYKTRNEAGEEEEVDEFDINKVRGIAIRLPLMAKGWGQDINGNDLVEEKDKLDQDKWITAPIDLRYDCARKVWISAHTHVEMLPHMHLHSGADVSGGGIAFASFYPDELAEAESFTNICLPTSDT